MLHKKHYYKVKVNKKKLIKNNLNHKDKKIEVKLLIIYKIYNNN